MQEEGFRELRSADRVSAAFLYGFCTCLIRLRYPGLGRNLLTCHLTDLPSPKQRLRADRRGFQGGPGGSPGSASVPCSELQFALMKTGETFL